MNSGEGLRRIATVVRVLGWLGAAFVGLGLVLEISLADLDVASFVGIALMVAAPVAIAYGVAWIIDGFAAPRQN